MWIRTYTDLGTILRATRDYLVTQKVLPSNLVYLSLTPDVQEPPQRSDRYAVISPGVQRVASHGDGSYMVGGGRELYVLDSDLFVTVFARLDLDEYAAADSYLTDELGVLAQVNAVFAYLHMFDPVDANSDYILAEPLKLNPHVVPPEPTIKPGWGFMQMAYSFSYQYELSGAEWDERAFSGGFNEGFL